MYSCLSPVRITNKQTGRKLLVKCGKCEHCRGARSAELSARVDREMLHNQEKGGTCLFVTLTYDNLNLPLYKKDSKSNYWYSNRCPLSKQDLERMYSDYVNEYCVSTAQATKTILKDLEELSGDKAISYLPIYDVLEYYKPAGRKGFCFGHLCYDDVALFLKRLRGNIVYTFKQSNKFEDRLSPTELYVKKLCNYEDFKFRYFLCGEYGPVSMRPHYHLLLWFDQRLDAKQQDYVLQELHKAWTLGAIFCEATYDGGIKNYLSGYVNGHLNIPRVLQAKSLKPFCTFSKGPTIGSFTADWMEIQDALNTGVVERDKRTFISEQDSDDTLPVSYYRRFFPRCRGFSTETFEAKLRVYEYVFEYFRSLGITHTAEEADKLQLTDIDWSHIWDIRQMKSVRIHENIDDFLAGDYELFDYMDKYASLVCYRYCVRFGTIPYCVLVGFEKVYTRLAMAQLRKFYEAQEEATKLHNTPYL